MASKTVRQTLDQKRSLSALVDQVERELLEVMARANLTPGLVLEHGRSLARHMCGEADENAAHVIALHEATHPAPHATVNALTLAYLQLITAKESKSEHDVAAALFRVGRCIGFSRAELDLVPPRVEAIVREQMDWSEVAREAEAETLRGLALLTSSEEGRRHAAKRHALTNALKTWALDTYDGMTGRRPSHRQVAEHLASKIPPHLAGASNDPERLIYDAIRARKHKA